MENTNKKEVIMKGEILFTQGESPQFMYYIHEGELEILSTSADYEGLDPSIIVSKSKRVGVVNKGSLISGFGNSLNNKSSKTVRVLKDSDITRYPIRGGINQLAVQDPSFAITILSHQLKRLEESIAEVSKSVKLYQYLSRINDNIALAYKILPKTAIAENFSNKSENLYNQFISNKGVFQEKIDAQFLIADNSLFLKKKYSFPGLPLESLIDFKFCNLTKKLLNTGNQLMGSIIKADSSIPSILFELISDNLLKVFDRIESIHNEIDSELSKLFGPNSSWSTYLVDGGGFDLWLNSVKIEPQFVKDYLSLIKKIHTFYFDISGKNLIEVFPGPKKIHEYYIKQKQVFPKSGGKASNTAGGVSPKDSGGNYRNSIQQIFEFALVDKEFQKGCIKAINDFKSLSNPFNTEQDGRKVRRVVSKYYWDLYTQAFIRHLKDPSAPISVKLMLKFGFLDESLLEEEQVSGMHRLLTQTEKAEKTENISVLFEQEFLTLVNKGQINPSISEMGLTYEAFLKEQEKHTSRKHEDAGGAAGNESIRKTIYEIDHRLSQTVAVCSGSTATSFPILTSILVKGNLDKLYVSKEKVASAVLELMNIDFSVFYREATLKLDSAREIIYEEIIPHFILLPSYGNKTMLWQDLDGKNRKTRGRIVIPIFFAGDLQKRLAHTFACFRWELNRTIKGGLWADPVEGGVTGSYFDYINFYKKNSKLSSETKEKITERFKSLRTNRDRFADDYIMWVLFEKDGVMRLNSVVREMFYRHVPFKKELRDKLESMPAFAEIANKYKNIHSKSIANYERKFKKYMDSNGVLPEKLQEFMKFLEL